MPVSSVSQVPELGVEVLYVAQPEPDISVPGGFLGAASALVVAGYKRTVKQADGCRSLRLALLVASRSTPGVP